MAENVNIPSETKNFDLNPEIGRELCRVTGKNGKLGGYMKDILTENLTERDNAFFVCLRCQGILKDACLSNKGEQFCTSCTKRDEQTHPNLHMNTMVYSLKCTCPLNNRGCTWLGTLEECEEHLDICGYVFEKCILDCGVVSSRDEQKIHVKNTCVQRLTVCEHCCEMFKFCDMSKHFDECPKMKVECSLQCGSVIFREKLTQHLAEECGQVEEECKLGCQLLLPRSEHEIHVKEHCEQRLAMCEHCGGDFKFIDIQRHLDSCPLIELECDLGCGKMVCRENMERHMDDDCGLMIIWCNLGCGVNFIRDELKIHLEDKCVLRITPCQHCCQDFKACDLSTHFEKCLKMKVECEIGCGMSTFRENMAQHYESECQEKEVDCPFAKYNCKVGTLKRKELDNHLVETQDQHTELKLNALEELVLKQNEIILTQSKQMEKMSQQITALYSISNITILNWRIEKLEFIKTSVSDTYQVSGCAFSFQFCNGVIRIEFPAQKISKYEKLDTIFKAKFQICLICRKELEFIKDIQSSVIEIKQKDIAKGCSREIAYISKIDMYNFSRMVPDPESPSEMVRLVDIEIFVIKQ